MLEWICRFEYRSFIFKDNNQHLLNLYAVKEKYESNWPTLYGQKYLRTAIVEDRPQPKANRPELHIDFWLFGQKYIILAIVEGRPLWPRYSSLGQRPIGKTAADGQPRGRLLRQRRGTGGAAAAKCNRRKNSRHLKVPCHQSFFSNLQKDRGRLGVGATARKEFLGL